MKNILYYKTFGDAQSPSNLLILHGLLGDMDNWRSAARTLSNKRHVIIADLRNHGNSPHVSGMSYGEMARDVVELMDYLHIEQLDVLGHSMGGKVSMRLAMEYPKRVARLIVVDIAPKNYPPHHTHLLAALNALPVSELSSRNDADAMLADTINNQLERMFLLKNLQRSDENGYRWQCNLDAITADYSEISREPFSGLDDALTFDGDSLFIRGEHSDYIDPKADFSTIRHHFPHARIETIPESGHIPHMENREAFFQVLETSGLLA